MTRDKIGNIVSYGDIVEFGRFKGVVYKICRDGTVWVQSDIGNIHTANFVKTLHQGDNNERLY